LGGQDIKNAGIYQATAWITGQFPNPSQPAKWLKDRDPQTFAALFPGKSAELALSSTAQPPRGEAGGGGPCGDTGQTDSSGPGGSGSGSRGGKAGKSGKADTAGKAAGK